VTDPGPRPDPYDLVFGAEGLDDRLFPPIAEEAAARGIPLDDPDRFLFLTSVGHLLRAIAGPPEPAAEGGDPGAGSGETMKQHGRLLYHAFRFWRGGKHRVAMDEASLRRLLDGEPGNGEREPGEWALAAPAPAGYLRLPPNLVWAAPAPGLRPEPAAGVFWTLDDTTAGSGSSSDAAGGGGVPTLHLLMALGVRADRPGFSVVMASGVADTEPHWADVDGRPGGRDFDTTLPGGELDRLYSVETTTELLKLASLCFRELERGG
jgi:hypothetical protein